MLPSLPSPPSPARVTAHYVPVPGQPRPKTVILMKFAPAVMQREARMPGS